MNRTPPFILYILLILVLTGSAFALNFVYFTNREVTVFGDRNKFLSGDTLCGPVRSNDTIAIMQSPVFTDLVITSGADFWRGVGYNPLFLPPYTPILNAPELPFPNRVDRIREQAQQQLNFFDAPTGMRARIQLMDHQFRLWWAEEGQPFDSSAFQVRTLADSAVVFFNCSISIWGKVYSTLILGASGRVGLEDNILYASSDSVTGQLMPGHPEKFALVSEGEIKILNTIANGRENSCGQGLAQRNPSCSSVALNGYYIALGESFMFDEQNDPDSGYVCPCQPDDRGTIYLWGGMAMELRNYFHRSTRNSTGYLKEYHCDPDTKFWDIGVFSGRENAIEPESFDFGEVAVGDTAQDTLRIANDFVPIRLDSVVFPQDVWSVQYSDSLQWEKQMIVRFSPQTRNAYDDTLWIRNNYYGRWFPVPVHGRALGASDAGESSVLPPSSFSLSAFPNPFNVTTNISYSVEMRGMVSLKIFDVTGRCAGTLAEGMRERGQYHATFDGGELASGVYFVRLSTQDRTATQKILLLK